MLSYLDETDPRAATGIAKPKVGAPTDINAPITTGVPLGLGGMQGGTDIPFSDVPPQQTPSAPAAPLGPPPDATTQPVTQPFTPTVPGGPDAWTRTADPMAFATDPARTAPATPDPIAPNAPTLPDAMGGPPPPAAPPAAPGAPPESFLPPPTPAATPPLPLDWRQVGTGADALKPPPQYVPGATYHTSMGDVTWDAAGHPSINGGQVDYAGNPMIEASSTNPFGGHTENFGPEGPHAAPTGTVPGGGTADWQYTYEGMFGWPKLQQYMAENPNLTLGDLVKRGELTKQDVVNAGFAHQTGYDDDWMNRKVNDSGATNIQFSGPPHGRNGGWYEGGVSSGQYHPVDTNPLNGTQLQDSMYLNGMGGSIMPAAKAPYGIDPITQKPLPAPAAAPPQTSSAKNPNGAYLTSGAAPSAPPIAASSPAGGRPGTTPDTRGPTPGGPLPIPLPTTPTTGSIAGTSGPGNAGGVPIGPASGPQVPGTGAPMAAGANSGVPGVSLTGINPDDSLLNKTITPSNSVDRFGLAQNKFDAFAKSTDPAYQATLRDTNRYNFGAGRGVSGMARNSIGDVATQRMNALDTQRTGFLTDALTGSIDDLYKNIGVAQQQQGFQKSLSDTGFNQGVTSAQLQDALTNSDFGRWLAGSNLANQTQAQEFGQGVTKAQLGDYLTNSAYNRASGNQQAGYANNPSDIQMILSQIFGSQSSAAMKSAAESFANAGKSSGGGNGTGLSDAQLKQIFAYITDPKNRPGGTTAQTTPPTTDYPYE